MPSARFTHSAFCLRRMATRVRQKYSKDYPRRCLVSMDRCVHQGCSLTEMRAREGYQQGVRLTWF
jgi:Rieske Fe-S protein